MISVCAVSSPMPMLVEVVSEQSQACDNTIFNIPLLRHAAVCQTTSGLLSPAS